MADTANRIVGNAIGTNEFLTLHACKSDMQQDSLNFATVLWRVHTSIYIYIYIIERERKRQIGREIYISINQFDLTHKNLILNVPRY